MLNKIWCGMMLVSIVVAFATGRTQELTAAMNEGAQAAVTLSVSMLGMMCAWTGIMHMAEQAGFVNKLAKLFSPVIRRLFPDFAEEPSVQNKMAMNFSANLLGLGNAATPLGVAAMKEMARLHPGDTPCRGTMLFVVINTASLQLIPTYAATLRSNYGSANPYDILPAVWLVSLLSLAVCIVTAKWMERRYG